MPTQHLVPQTSYAVERAMLEHHGHVERRVTCSERLRRYAKQVDYYETVFADLQELLLRYEETRDARWVRQMSDVIGRNGGLKHLSRYPHRWKRKLGFVARVLRGEYDE